MSQKKVILITGASRGIGAFTATLLAQQGHKIIINYAHNDVEANAVLAKIQALGGIASLFKANIGDSNQVIQLFDYAIQTYGQLDIVINNAGIMRFNKIEDVDDETIDQIKLLND